MQLRNKINAMEFCEITIPSDITDHWATEPIWLTYRLLSKWYLPLLRELLHKYNNFGPLHNRIDVSQLVLSQSAS